jgi:hypothetical protein
MSGVLLPVLPAALMYELRSDLPIVIAFTKTLYYLPIPNLPERKIFAYSATSRRCAPSHTLTLDLQSISDEWNKWDTVLEGPNAAYHVYPSYLRRLIGTLQ